MSVTTWWRKMTGKRKRVTGAAQPAAGQRDRTPDPGPDRPRGKPGRRPSRVDQGLGVLGLDVYRGGWVGAVLDPTGKGTPLLVTGATVAEVVAAAGPVAVVGIDIPIGLPDDSRRAADVQTRTFLVGKASSVFTTPVRDAVYAPSYSAANTVNRERIGAGISKQAYELRRRIIEVDHWLRQDLDVRVVEVHPEAAFAVMAGSPLLSRKRTAPGAQERRDALAAAGVYAPTTAPHGVGGDDMLDACAAAWTAHRVKTGAARSFPEAPETFSDGIPCAIHA
jgi:predicted RNase H-like nuclease